MRNIWRGVAGGAMLVSLLAVAPQALASRAGATTASGAQTPLAASQAKALSTDVTDSVIVVFRNQPSPAEITGPEAGPRQRSVEATQAPVVDELHRVAARNLRTLSLVDALSATVSPGEAARLAANPSVAEVIPDSLIKGPDVQSSVTAAGTGSSASTSGTQAGISGTQGATPNPLPIPPGACPAPGQPAYLGEELSLIHADSNDPSEPTARSLGFTGAGVKVAFMAEGIDIDNPDFIRSDGSHVFVDYQDFSGDGTAAPTSAGEAFLDASAIASQGKEYNIQDFGQIPLASACRIRVEGVAPGASLVGLKVFAQNGYSTTAGLLEAVNYAVTVDHVNVLNESLGYNPFPTTQSQDVLEQFNDAAVAAGTTVTVAAGDAGPADTIGSPDTDPKVINVGASTDYRFYAETGSDGYVPPIATKGWLSDGISGLSSGGFEQTGPTDDVVAPGDLSFAACTPNLKMYSDCSNLAFQPSSVEFSGGTSESSPLTAGTAALVIQAYRQTHGGATPSPALVKQIIVSTADDLGHPATEQGSGIIDAYRAVLAAESIKTGRTGAAQGNQILLSTGQLHATALPGTSESWPLTITNDGNSATRLNLSTRTLGPALDTQTGSVVLSQSGPHFFNNLTDLRSNYQELHFTVAPGRDRLITNIAYPGDPSESFLSAVSLVLIDPEGNFAADASVQGVGNAAQAEVRYPAAGKWTALIFSPTAKNQGTLGTVKFRAQTFDFQTLGTVSPRVVNIPAGTSATVQVHETTPSTPGDEAAAVLVSNPAGQTSSTVVTLRSLVDLSSGGHFAGTLTGGNGRQTDLGQVDYYQWKVPAGEAGKTLRTDVQIGDQATDPVQAYLVDDQGQTVSIATNRVTTSFGSSGPVEEATSSVEVAATAPRAGLWTLILDFAPAITGNLVATPFTGTAALVGQPASGASLPSSSSTVLPAGQASTVGVTVTNTSASPIDYFLDARLTKDVPMQLTGQSKTNLLLPMKASADSPSWLIPSDTESVTVSGQAPEPLTFDYGPGIGDPDLGATTASDTATGTWTSRPITSGLWFADPALIGPFGATSPTPVRSQLFADVTTREFDAAVTSPTGDLWLQSVTPSAPLSILTVQPGQTFTIPVTITPTARAGSVVSGTLFVDELSEVPSLEANALNFQPAQAFFPSGSQVAALPYTYTVG